MPENCVSSWDEAKFWRIFPQPRRKFLSQIHSVKIVPSCGLGVGTYAATDTEWHKCSPQATHNIDPPDCIASHPPGRQPFGISAVAIDEVVATIATSVSAIAPVAIRWEWATLSSCG
jgi:hypothetical protein